MPRKRQQPRSPALAPRSPLLKKRWQRSSTLPKGMGARELLEMHGRHDMSIREIAEEFNVKENVVEANLPREVTLAGRMEIAARILKKEPGKYARRELARMVRISDANLATLLKKKPGLKKNLKQATTDPKIQAKTNTQVLRECLEELGIKPPESFWNTISIELALTQLLVMEPSKLSKRERDARSYAIELCKARLASIRTGRTKEREKDKERANPKRKTRRISLPKPPNN